MESFITRIRNATPGQAENMVKLAAEKGCALETLRMIRRVNPDLFKELETAHPYQGVEVCAA